MQCPGWALLLYLVYSQAIAAINYEHGLLFAAWERSAALAESDIGVWYGFVLADLVVYVPLLAAGLSGIWLGAPWRRPVFGAALGITLYWPVAILATIVATRESNQSVLTSDPVYWVMLPLIVVWALWAMWRTLISIEPRKNES